MLMLPMLMPLLSQRQVRQMSRRHYLRFTGASATPPFRRAAIDAYAFLCHYFAAIDIDAFFSAYTIFFFFLILMLPPPLLMLPPRYCAAVFSTTPLVFDAPAELFHAP